MQLIDILGVVVRDIYSETLARDQKIDINTSDLPAGVYNVKATSGNNTVTKKLSVIR